MSPDLKKILLPMWMNKGEVSKLADKSHTWFSQIGKWALWPLQQIDPMTCSEEVLNLLAWQRDINRFRGEGIDLFRLRVRYAFANAKDSGSIQGFKRIFDRLGVGYVEVEERMPGRDWDVISIRLSDNQLGENQALLDELIKCYGRTCRRYEWKIEIPIPVGVCVYDFANEYITERT